MKFILHDLTIEVTRRTNEEKDFQKGLPQNIDITREIIDAFFDHNEIERIDSLTFTGGEPTLNSEMIIYIIDKIIFNKINVAKINMTTNGKIIDKELIQAFSRFNSYRNRWIANYTLEQVTDRELASKIISFSFDNHVQVDISAEEDEGLRLEAEYRKNSIGLWIMKKNILNSIKEKSVSTIPVRRELKEFLYSKELDAYAIAEKLYLTANGFITNQIDGNYIDMDINNMGNIKGKPLQEMIAEYGAPAFCTPKIPIEKLKLKKRNL